MHESAVLGKDFSLTDVLAVLPDRVVERATIVVRDGRIERVGEAAPAFGRVIEGNGAVVIPGMIDSHGAMSDWSAVRSAGVATQLHTLDFSTPNLADGPSEVELCDPSRPATSRLVDVRPLLRLDLDDPAACLRSIECVRSCRDHAAPIVVSVDDGRRPVGEVRLGDDDPLQWFTIHAIARRLRLGTRWPESADDIDRAVEWGASVAEFPVTIEAARRARERGLKVIAGASLGQASGTPRTVGTDALVELGLVDGVAALDHPTSLLATVSDFVLRGVCDLQHAIRLVTSGPAEAYGLIDRGRLAAGQRGDLTVLRARGERFVVEETIGADGRRLRADREQPVLGDVQSSA